jgi:phosphatidylinositol alpha-1,6-mannosyltransferase
MKALNLLCLVTDAYGGRGGIAQACRDAIDAFASSEDIKEIDVRPRHAPDPVRAIPSRVRQFTPSSERLVYSARALMGACLQRPNIVFCNHLYMAPLAAFISQSIGARLIVQLHGIEIWRPPSVLQRRALEVADLLWCVSRHTRARALAQTNVAPERAIVVNNTVDPSFKPGDRSNARARFALGEEVVILTVGRLDPQERYKGHDRVIALLPALRAKGRKIVYLVAGAGLDQQRLEALARKLSVDDCVRFLGNVCQSDLPDLYRAADFFALPSTGEGFGIAFLEAMACGTPAIGLAVGGARDALADGELGACVHVEEFTDAFLQAMDAPPQHGSQLSMAVDARFGHTVFGEHVRQALTRITTPVEATTTAYCDVG